MTAIRLLSSGPVSSDTGIPATSALPALGRTTVDNTRTVVVFPAPLGPRKPNTSPVETSKLTSSSAVLCPNRLVRPRARIAVSTVTTSVSTRVNNASDTLLARFGIAEEENSVAFGGWPAEALEFLEGLEADN